MICKYLIWKFLSIYGIKILQAFAIISLLHLHFFHFLLNYRVRIDDAGSLVIQYVRKEDHGRYQCSAKNLAATRDSRPIRLKVHGELDNYFPYS